MRKFLLLLFVCCCSMFAAIAQEQTTPVALPAETPSTSRVYAELLGSTTNFFGLNKNVVVTVDLGQYQSAFKSYTLLDSNGKEIKFNSMVAAMNYMGERGWKFVQTYIVTIDKQHIHHWLMYKDVTDMSQIYDGIQVSNTDSAPAKQKKEKAKKEKTTSADDDVYSD